MLQQAVLDPHRIRPSYFRFLNQITDDAFDKINRGLIGNFMADPSRSADFALKSLDLNHVSRQYFELVHLWLLL
jgi:hypothetical protein